VLLFPSGPDYVAAFFRLPVRRGDRGAGLSAGVRVVIIRRLLSIIADADRACC
jgi:hypothetical protein